MFAQISPQMHILGGLVVANCDYTITIEFVCCGGLRAPAGGLRAPAAAFGPRKALAGLNEDIGEGKTRIFSSDLVAPDRGSRGEWLGVRCIGRGPHCSHFYFFVGSSCFVCVC